MATKFDFKKSPDVNGTADKTTLYPKIVVAGTKNLENIADDIAKRSGFKAGTVIGLFSDLENLLTDYRKHSKKCTFYTLRFGCSFAAVNTIKPQLL